jgi:hypothetical protein
MTERERELAEELRRLEAENTDLRARLVAKVFVEMELSTQLAVAGLVCSTCGLVLPLTAGQCRCGVGGTVQ